MSLAVKPTPAQLLDALNKSVAPMDEMVMRIKALLYGESGVGKTVEAFKLAHMCLPPGKRILYIDTGEGWVSLQNHPELMAHTQRVAYTGIAQIKTLVQVIQAGVPGWDDYGVIIFDEFSTSAKQFKHVVFQANDLDELTEGFEYKHWGILSRNIEDTYWKLMELKETHNMILIAHERIADRKKTGISQIAPSFMDSIEGTVKENVHVVARMTAEVVNLSGAPQYHRSMQVHPTKLVVAKSRIGGLDIIVTPDRFNERMQEWLESGGKLSPEREPVTLANEAVLETRLASQDEMFTGFEASSEEN